MERTQYVVALEIGSSKIVGAIAEKTSNGFVRIEHLEEAKLFSNCVRYGCVMNVETVKGNINKILRCLENRIGGTIKDVYIGMSGRSLRSELMEVRRGLDSSTPITKETIASIIRSATAEHKPPRDYEVVEVVPRTFIVDNNETKDPCGQYGSSINIQLNMIELRSTVKMNLERSIPPGVHVSKYIVTPLAVAREVLTESEKSLGCMLVDVGAETTTVSIFKGGSLVHLLTLPLGGRNITLDIVNGLNVVEETAETVKKKLSNPLDPSSESIIIEGMNSTDVSNFISARAGEIIANINQQFAYAGLTSEDVRGIVVTGGGVLLQGFQQRLEEATKLKVRMANNPQSLDIRDHSINRPEYVQIFSLLAKAGKILPDGKSCLDIPTYNDGPKIVTKQPEPEPTKEEEKKPQKRKRGDSFLDRWGKMLSNLLDESENDQF